MNRLTIANALQSPEGWSETYREQFRHGSMTVEIYNPDKIDDQEPVCGEFQFMQQWVSENDRCNEIATNSY